MINTALDTALDVDAYRCCKPMVGLENIYCSLTPYIPRLLTATCEIAEETFVMFKLPFMAVNQIVMRASTMKIFPAVK